MIVFFLPYDLAAIPVTKQEIYCELILIWWTFNFVYFVGRAIYEFKIPTKYLRNDLFLSKIENSRIKESMNMSILFKQGNFVPMSLNNLTVSHICYKLSLCLFVMAGLLLQGLSP